MKKISNKPKILRIIKWVVIFILSFLICWFLFAIFGALYNFYGLKINISLATIWTMFLTIWYIPVLGLVAGILITAYLLYEFVFKKQNFIKNESSGVHGNARFLVNQKIKEKDIKNLKDVYEINPKKASFIVLAQKMKYEEIYYGISKKHLGVFGGTGSGKTQKIIIPTLVKNAQLEIHLKPNLIVTDLKGEIDAKYHDWLKNQGYSVYVFDLMNPMNPQGFKFNPLSGIQEKYKTLIGDENNINLAREIDNTVALIIESLMPQKQSTNSSSSFFFDMAKDLVKGLVYLILESYKKDVYQIDPKKLSIPSIKSLISKVPLLKFYVEAFAVWKPNSKALEFLGNSLMNDAEETAGGFLANVQDGLSAFSDAGIRYLTCESSFDLEQFFKNDKPSILLIKVNQGDIKSYPLVTMLVNLIYNKALEIAKQNKTEINTGGTLERQLLFLLDEAGNMPAINDLAEKISLSRSLNIFWLLAFQSYSQAQRRYGQTWKDILANINTEIILQTTNEDAKMLSESFGTKTVIKKSFSNSKNSKVSNHSESQSIASVPLMTAGDIVSLPDPFGFIVTKKHFPALVKFGYAYDFKNINQIPISQEVRFDKTKFNYEKDYTINLNEVADRLGIKEAYERFINGLEEKKSEFQNNNENQSKNVIEQSQNKISTESYEFEKAIEFENAKDGIQKDEKLMKSAFKKYSGIKLYEKYYQWWIERLKRADDLFKNPNYVSDKNFIDIEKKVLVEKIQQANEELEMIRKIEKQNELESEVVKNE